MSENKIIPIKGQNTGVQILYTEASLSAFLLAQKALGRSLRQIAKEDFHNRVTYGDIYRCLYGKYPKGAIKRSALGLPVTSLVVSLNGIIPAGALCLAALQCFCGQWFIPNHPLRQKCFVCSPVRKRKKGHTS